MSTCRGYHPRIFNMRFYQQVREEIQTNAIRAARRAALRLAYDRGREHLAIIALRSLDRAWESWYDDDNNLPPEQTMRDRTRLIEARCRFLSRRFRPPTAKEHNGLLIWLDFENDYVVLDKQNLARVFNSREEAQNFINNIVVFEVHDQEQ